MTHPRSSAKAASPLPGLRTIGPHTLIQIDIVPHYLQGGQAVACFNALEVGTRYPSGKAYPRRRSQEALEFTVYIWQTVGISEYTQVDNEGCFSGGSAHPYVLGRLVRLALMVGTELVFSAVGEPKSQSHIERFHQDYNHHVWEDTYLPSLQGVNWQSEGFFQRYRQRPHPQLGGRTPQEAHQATPVHKLPADFQIPPGRIPLYAGRVHFIRRVQDDHTIRVLNVSWVVPQAEAGQGVWATLELQPKGAWLRVYDEAPDVPGRKQLAAHPFPVQEPVFPRPEYQEGRPSVAPVPRSQPRWAIRLSEVVRHPLALVGGTMSWRSLRC